MFKKKDGQGTLEYVIILIAVISCVAWAATAFIAGKENDKRGVGKIVNQTAEIMKKATGEIGKIGAITAKPAE
jgi:beta-lactamase regulating signal transducer with metallopeptidase domain